MTISPVGLNIFLYQFQKNSETADELADEWLGYCAFHLGDYKLAMQQFELLTKKQKKPKPENWLNLACCYFFLGMYPEAEEVSYFKKGLNETI